MKKNKVIKFLILTASSLFLSIQAFGEVTDVLVRFPSKFKNVEGPFELSNFPRLRDQSHLPICLTISAYYIATYHHCKQNNIVPCSGIPPEKDMSIPDINSKCWRDNDGIKSEGNLFYTPKGSALDLCLKNMRYGVKIQSELCFSYDKFISQIKGNENLLEEKRKKIEGHYYNYKAYLEEKKKNPEATFCEECYIKDVYREFFSYEKPTGFKMPSIDSLMDVIKYRSLERFWYGLLAGSCEGQMDDRPIRIPKHLTVKSFPKYNETPPFPSKEQTKDKIKELLKKGLPVGLGFCIGRNGECAGHSVVIQGYRRVCYTKDGSEKCGDFYKLANTWGADFYPNEWFYADALLSQSPEKEISLDWYEKYEPEK